MTHKMLKGRRRKCSYSTENVNESSFEGTVFSLDSAVLSKTSLCMDNGAQIRVRNLPSNAKIKLYPVRMNDMVPIFNSESYYRHKKPVRVVISRDRLQDMFECEEEDEWETERCVEKPVKTVPVLTERCVEKPVKTEYKVCRNEQRFKNPFTRKKLKRKVSYPTKRRSRLSTRNRSITFSRRPNKHLLPRRKVSPCRFRAPRSASTSVRSRPPKKCRSRSRTRSRCRPVKRLSRSRSKSCTTKSPPPPRPRRLKSPRPSYTSVKLIDTTVCQACGRHLDETCCERRRHLQVKTARRRTPSPLPPPAPPRGRCLQRRPTPMPRKICTPASPCPRPPPSCPRQPPSCPRPPPSCPRPPPSCPRPPPSCPPPSIIRERVREECYVAPPPPPPSVVVCDSYCSECEMGSRIVSPSCQCNSMYCKQKLPMRNSWSNEYAVIKPRQCEQPCPRVPLCSTNQKSCIYDTKGCPLTDSLGFPMRDCSGRPILRFDCDGSPINCYYDHDTQGIYSSYDTCSECHMFMPCYDEMSSSPCNGDNLCFKCSINSDRCCEVDFTTKHKKSPFLDSVIKYFRRV